MKLIIAGTRTFGDQRHFDYVMTGWEKDATEVFSGECPGPDRMGERWARQHGIPVRRFPADWAMHGRKAGPIRNAQMAEEADQAIVFWDGRSRGTRNLMEEMRKRGKNVEIALFGATHE